MIIPKLYLPFSSIELEKLLKHSFDWENITTTDEDFNRFKDFLIQIGVNSQVIYYYSSNCD